MVVCHSDRLTRRPIELEHFLDVVATAGVRHVRFVATSGLDVGTGDGLMVLRVLGAVAANKSATKSRRILRKMDEVAESGRPHGGSVRPYGYEKDRMTVLPAEAEVVRAVAARYLSGESLRSIAQSLNDQGITASADGPWTTSALRRILQSARIAGLREHRGEIVGPAAWPALISAEKRDKVLAGSPCGQRRALAAPAATCSPVCCAAASVEAGCGVPHGRAPGATSANGGRTTAAAAISPSLPSRLRSLSPRRCSTA